MVCLWKEQHSNLSRLIKCLALMRCARKRNKNWLSCNNRVTSIKNCISLHHVIMIEQTCTLQKDWYETCYHEILMETKSPNLESWSECWLKYRVRNRKANRVECIKRANQFDAMIVYGFLCNHFVRFIIHFLSDFDTHKNVTMKLTKSNVGNRNLLKVWNAVWSCAWVIGMDIIFTQHSQRWMNGLSLMWLLLLLLLFGNFVSFCLTNGKLYPSSLWVHSSTTVEWENGATVITGKLGGH